MANDPRLENYLSNLDRALAPFSVSDRADIVTEIKSHVFSATERGQSLESVLSALGEAETVANRYLLERNLTPARPPVSPVVKWIVVGFLGTFAIFFGGLIFLVLHFSPIVEVDTREERVSLLGGLIRVDGEDIRLAGQKVGNGRSFSGNSSLDLAKGGKLSIKFANGQVALSTATGSRLLWQCKGSGKVAKNEVVSSADGQVLDLTGPRFLKCDISVPEGAVLSIEGTNGSVGLSHPKFSADVELANGKVDIDPDRLTKYAYDLNVNNGKVDSIESDTNPQFKIAVRIANGAITAD